MRPERVNKWPNSMTDMMTMMMIYRAVNMNFVLTRYRKKCRKYLLLTARHTAYLTDTLYSACRIYAGEIEIIVPVPARA